MTKKWLALSLLILVNLWLFGAAFWSTWAVLIRYLGRFGAGLAYLVLVGLLVVGPVLLVRRLKKGDVFVVLCVVNVLALGLLIWRQPVWTRIRDYGLALPRALTRAQTAGEVPTPSPTPSASPADPATPAAVPAGPATPAPTPQPEVEAEAKEPVVGRFIPTLDSRWERVFAPDLPSMEFEYDALDIGPKDELVIHWKGPDGAGSDAVPARSGRDLHHHVRSPSGGWTPGHYEFEMVVNGKPQQSVTMWFYATQKSAQLDQLFEYLYDGDGQKALELLLRHPELAQMRGRDPGLNHLDKEHTQADIKAHRLDKLTSVSVDGQTVWPDCGTTALHLALMHAPEVTRRLLELKAPLDVPDHAGFLPCHRAILADRADLLEKLLDHGAELEGRDGTQSLTPLHLAVRQVRVRCVKVLLERGADPNLDYKNRHPIDDACGLDKVEIARLLLEHGFTSKPSLFMVKSREMASLFLSHGAELEERNAKAETPMIRACWAGRDELVEKLVQAGAEVNASDARGYTPLYGALAACRPETVRLLLEYGARLDVTNADGKSPEQYLRESVAFPGTAPPDQERRQQNLDLLIALPAP